MDIASLRTEQQVLAKQVVLQDDFDCFPPRLIAGAEVGFEEQGKVTRAALVILEYPSLQMIEHKIARIATSMPYIPGFLSFPEYPALMAAWKMLEHRPDLRFVDGHGIAHPRRLGVASHPGLLVDVPTPGVAKRRLCGQFAPLDEWAGAHKPLLDKGEQLGWVWRSKKSVIRCSSPAGIVSLWRRRCSGLKIALLDIAYLSPRAGQMR